MLNGAMRFMLNDKAILEIHPYDGRQSNVGLANKLRAIISSIKYCEDNNYKLNVYWDTFYLLFPYILNDELFTRDAGTIIVNPLFYAIGEENNKYGGFNGEANVDYYSTSFPFAQIFKKLIPAQSIQNKIELYTKTFDIENGFGVHLRLGDFISFSKINNLYLPTIDDYFKKIDSIIDETSHFYFTSDDSDSYLSMKTRYGNKVHYIENKNINRMDDNNFYDAYIDLILLSKTKFILGNNFSTFSQHAARIEQKKLIYLEN